MTATTDTAPAATPTLRTAALDIVYGERPAAEPCGNCGRIVPPLPGPRLELELDDESVLCLVCADKAHRGLRLILGVFGFALDARDNGDRKAFDETLQGIRSALELIYGDQLNRPAPNRQTRRHTGKPRRRR